MCRITERICWISLSEQQHTLYRQKFKRWNGRNAELHKRLAQEARHRLDQQVERMVPDYQKIDHDPRWHRWLLGVDSLSGRIRQQLLNEAVASGNATRVVSFFKDFRKRNKPRAKPLPDGQGRPRT